MSMQPVAECLVPSDNRELLQAVGDDLSYQGGGASSRSQKG